MQVVYLNARRGKTDERTRRLSVTTTYIILLIYLLCVVINLEVCLYDFVCGGRGEAV